MEGPRTFPATRTTKSSPKPASKTSSGRHTAVAAAEDGGERLLAFGELRQDFLLHRRKPRVSADEAIVACLETLERLNPGVGGLGSGCHASRSGSSWTSARMITGPKRWGWYARDQLRKHRSKA